MRRCPRLTGAIFPLVFTVLISANVHAQFYTQKFGFGLSAGQMLGQTEGDKLFKNNSPRLTVRGYLRYRVFDHLQGDFGAGWGEVKGDSFRTQVIPIDYRFIWSPFESDMCSPYVYAGVGALNVNVQEHKHGGVTWQGWTGFVPAGLGIQFRLNEYSTLDINGGYNYTLSDSLNGIRGVSKYKDKYWTFLVGLSTGSMTREADPDNDGLSNKQEEELGTNPRNPDSDGDGLTDGQEVMTYKTDPLKADSDGDSLSDGVEVRLYHTEPNKADTDGDGLSDGDEVLKYHTDPLNADTDGDGLSDGDEVLKYHTDPLKKDSDGDGLSDAEEILKYHTDPLNSDSDGDGLTDGDEVLKHHTDPLKKDTDGDGLTDGEEVLHYNTDPLNTDTDGGSVDDGTEVHRGTNPLDPADDVPKKPTFSVDVGQKIVLEGVVFKSGKAELSPESELILDKAYNTLKAFGEIHVEIQGHTDDVGKPEKNLKLSQDRADAVKAFLVRKGIPADRITTKGYGSEKPLVPNTTDEGRKTNRRIEFVRMK